MILTIALSKAPGLRHLQPPYCRHRGIYQRKLLKTSIARSPDDHIRNSSLLLFYSAYHIIPNCPYFPTFPGSMTLSSWLPFAQTGQNRLVSIFTDIWLFLRVRTSHKISLDALHFSIAPPHYLQYSSKMLPFSITTNMNAAVTTVTFS